MGVPLVDAKQCLGVGTNHGGRGCHDGDELSKNLDEEVAFLRSSHLLSERFVPYRGLELVDEPIS